jgi:hypothetical protein
VCDPAFNSVREVHFKSVILIQHVFLCVCGLFNDVGSSQTL